MNSQNPFLDSDSKAIKPTTGTETFLLTRKVKSKKRESHCYFLFCFVWGCLQRRASRNAIPLKLRNSKEKRRAIAK